MSPIEGLLVVLPQYPKDGLPFFSSFLLCVWTCMCTACMYMYCVHMYICKYVFMLFVFIPSLCLLLNSKHCFSFCFHQTPITRFGTVVASSNWQLVRSIWVDEDSHHFCHLSYWMANLCIFFKDVDEKAGVNSCKPWKMYFCMCKTYTEITDK